MDAKPTLDNTDEKRNGKSAPNSEFQFATDKQAMAVLALSHTKLEQKLYEIMFYETRNSKTKIGEFSIRYLQEHTEDYSYSRIQRARIGLALKMSIEAQPVVNASRRLVIYTVYSPLEILERRKRTENFASPNKQWDDEPGDSYLWHLIERVIEKRSLSRREAQVALHCAEGKTNVEIGEKLFIHEETVKFHLRNIFIKLGIKRRTELIAYLFKN